MLNLKRPVHKPARQFNLYETLSKRIKKSPEDEPKEPVKEEEPSDHSDKRLSEAEPEEIASP